MTTPTMDADLDGGDAPALLSKLSLEPHPSDVSIKGSEAGVGEGDLTISLGALQPLQNPLILQHLFERCPWEILKNLRQVCKLWHDLSLEAWLSSFTIEVIDHHRDDWDDEESFIQVRSWRGGPIPFQKFVDNFDNYCPKPFRNMKLNGFEFPFKCAVCKEGMLDQLWNLCGNGMHLTTLELYRCEFTDVAQFHELIYKFCTHLQHLKLFDINLYGHRHRWYPEPIGNRLTAFKHVVSSDEKPVNLKSLFLNIQVWYYNESDPDFSIRWPELLSQFPSLTSLKLEIDCYRDEVDQLKGGIHLRRIGGLCPRLTFDESFDNKEPFLQMEVNSVTFGSSHVELVSMWRLSGRGKYLTILELNHCTFPTVEKFRNIIYTSCSNLRHLKLTDCKFPPLSAEDRRIPCQYIEPDYGRQLNLKSLTVSRFYADEYQPHLPVTWLEILSHYPSLTSLDVELIGEGAAPFPQFEISRILEAIRLVKEHDDGLQLLQSFQMRPHLRLSSLDIVSDKIIRFLHKLQLPLEKFVIKVDLEKKSGPAVLEKALEFNCKTLAFISVHAGKTDGLPLLHWNFPCHVQLINLDSLRICQLLCPHLEFLKITPNLRKLSIYGIHNGQFIGGNSDIVANTSKSSMANFKLISLRSFTLDSVISLEDLTCLIKWMPRLVELTLPLDDELFALVCKHWRNLEKLTVLGNGLTDEGVIGIKWREEESNPGTATPNITDLHDLGRLRLWTEHLTDSAVFNGFAHMAKLTSIWTFGKPMKLSHGARRCLKKKTILWEQFDEDDPVALDLLE